MLATSPLRAESQGQAVPPSRFDTRSFQEELNLVKPGRTQPAKEFSIPALDGKDLRLSDYRGKVVLLNFWATWCPPCLEELPAMDRLHQRYRRQGFAVLAVSVDAEGAQVVASFVKRHGLGLPVGTDPKMAVAGQYGVRALPSSFVIDKQGAIVGQAFGPREWDSHAAHALVESLLRQ